MSEMDAELSGGNTDPASAVESRPRLHADILVGIGRRILSEWQETEWPFGQKPSFVADGSRIIKALTDELDRIVNDSIFLRDMYFQEGCHDGHHDDDMIKKGQMFEWILYPEWMKKIRDRREAELAARSKQAPNP